MRVLSCVSILSRFAIVLLDVGTLSTAFFFFHFIRYDSKCICKTSRSVLVIMLIECW